MDFGQVARELEIDESAYVSLLKRFCEVTRDDIVVLERALRESNLDAVHAAAHSIKGASASLSLSAIYAASSAICETAKQGSSEEIDVLCQAIRTELDSLATRLDDSTEGSSRDA